MKFFKKTIIVYIIILTLCCAVSCGEKLNAETKPAEDNLSDDVSIGSETNNTPIETVTESSTMETEATDERTITENGVSAFKNADGKIYLYDDDENKLLTESEYDNVRLWQDMLLLEKNNKEYLYCADYSGTLEHRQRRGFLFPDLTEGFDDITQITSGIYVIEANGKKFPACISPNKIFEDIDCSKINHIAEGRILAEGLYRERKRPAKLLQPGRCAPGDAGPGLCGGVPDPRKRSPVHGAVPAQRHHDQAGTGPDLLRRGRRQADFLVYLHRRVYTHDAVDQDPGGG